MLKGWKKYAVGAVGAVAAYKMALTLLRPRKSVSGTLVLITGAAAGVGKQLAFEFARRGCRLILLDINAAQLDAVASEVQLIAVQAATYVCDLSVREDIYACADRVKCEHGNPDIVVCNAGVVSGGYFLSSSDAKNELTFKVNALSHMWMAKAFLPAMVDADSGSFTIVSSVASYMAAPAMVDYASSKAAARSFAEGLSLELAYLNKRGVHVTCICPSHVSTELFKGFDTAGGPLSLTPEAVAAATVDAIEMEKGLVILPTSLQYLIPPATAAYGVLGILGIAELGKKNLMAQWDRTAADETFERMTARDVTN